MEAAARAIEVGSATPAAIAKVLGIDLRTLKNSFRRRGWVLARFDQRWRVLERDMATTNGLEQNPGGPPVSAEGA